jgi:restriction system protein
MAAIVVVVLLFGATHGLVLLPVLVGVPLWLVLRTQRRRHLRAWRLHAARDLATLRSLSPVEFERVMAAVLCEAGWKLHVVGGSGDEGADLIGSDPHGRSALVQCKRYAGGHTVGSPAVQLVIGARAIHRVERALIVTTSRFTEPARRLAAREGVGLVDETSITQMAAPALAARDSPSPASWAPPTWAPPDPGTWRA